MSSELTAANANIAATVVGSKTVRLPVHLYLSVQVAPFREWSRVSTLSLPGLRVASHLVEQFFINTDLLISRVNITMEERIYNLVRAGVIPVMCDLGLLPLDPACWEIRRDQIVQAISNTVLYFAGGQPCDGT